MSSFLQTTAQCTRCETDFPVRQYASINITRDPDLKKKLLSREIITFSCPSCGARSEVPHDILYHDMERRIMIMLATKDGQGVASIATPALDFSAEMLSHHRLRIVTQWDHLIERITVIDAGLDEFVFEGVRTRLWMEYSQSQTLVPDTFLLASVSREPTLVYHFVDTARSTTTGFAIEDNGLYEMVREAIYVKRGVKPFPNGEWVVISQQTASERLREHRLQNP